MTPYISELHGTGFQRRGSFFDVMRPNKGNENQTIDLGNIEALESTPTSPPNTLGNTLALPHRVNFQVTDLLCKPQQCNKEQQR